MPEPARLSLLVAASADSERLRRVLVGIGGEARQLGAEIVVALNASRETLPPQAAAALEGLGARLVFEPAVGKSHALNRGVREARGAVVCFTDDDTIPQPGWLASLAAPLLAADRPAALVGCGGPVRPVFGAVPDWFERIVMSRTTSFLGPRHDAGDEPCEYGERGEGPLAPIGANSAYLREVLLRHPFDPELGPSPGTGLRGGEDVALARQLLTAGHRIRYVPEAVVLHPVSPERATFRHARYAHLAQGVERIRVARVLGREPPHADRLRRRLRRYRLRAVFVLPRWHAIRRQLRAEIFRGMLAELEGDGERLLREQAREAGLSDPSSAARRR